MYMHMQIDIIMVIKRIEDKAKLIMHTEQRKKFQSEC